MAAAELRALARRVCEEAPSRELDMLVSVAVGRGDYETHVIDYVDNTSRRVPWRGEETCGAYTTSRDAAASLMPKRWRLESTGETPSRSRDSWTAWVRHRLEPHRDGAIVVHAPTEAQARTAAALLAMATDMEDPK